MDRASRTWPRGGSSAWLEGPAGELLLAEFFGAPAGSDTTITATPGEASAAGVTASIVTASNTVITCSVGAASAAGVTANVNRTLQAQPGAASAAGVSARLNTTISAVPATASATGVTARANVTLQALPGGASAAGVTARLNTTVSAAPGEASAAGVSATITTGGAIDVRVSWLQFDTSAAAVNVKVSWLQFDTAATPVDVRVSWLAFDTAVQQLIAAQSAAPRMGIKANGETFRLVIQNGTIVGATRRNGAFLRLSVSSNGRAMTDAGDVLQLV